MAGALADLAILETVVPTDSDVDLQDVFQSWDREFTAESSSVVPFIEQRQFLYLDELVTIYLVLRIPAAGEDQIKQLLSCLSVNLEAHAIGQTVVRPPDPNQPPQQKEVKELLASELVNISGEDPLMLATELQAEGDDDSYQFVFLFWKTVIPIGRPKGRLQKLAVYFTPSATFNPSQTKPKAAVIEDDYLPSQIPLSGNLLQAFTNDDTYGEVKPFLSESRLTRLASGIPIVKQPSRSLRCGPRKLFRAAPAFLWRIRFLRFPNLSETEAILACFDIEFTQYAAYNVSLDKVDLQLTSGHSEVVAADLPRICQANEQHTLIYKIFPQSSAEKAIDIAELQRTLTIILTSTVLVSKTCLPTVKIKWKTALELPPSRPPSRAAPLSSISERAPPLSHDALIMTGHVAESDPSMDVADGVTLSITAPDEIVIGREFRWDVLVVNRSEKVQRLALVSMPRRRHQEIIPNLKRPGSSGTHSEKKDLAPTIVDENVLFAVHKNSILDPTELVCLTPDVKIG